MNPDSLQQTFKTDTPVEDLPRRGYGDFNFDFSEFLDNPHYIKKVWGSDFGFGFEMSPDLVLVLNFVRIFIKNDASLETDALVFIEEYR